MRELYFRVAFIALVAAMCFFQFRRRSEIKKKRGILLKSQPIRSLTERAVSFAGALWTLSLVVYALALSPMDLHIHFPAWMRWAGAAAMLACFPLSAWVFATMDMEFSPHLDLLDDHRLVTSGPYAYVRHPLYSTLFLFAAATTLLSADLFVAVAALIVCLVLTCRIATEEAMMEKRFGKCYQEYRKATGALMPKIF